MTDRKPFRLEDIEGALQAVSPDFYLDGDVILLRNGDRDGNDLYCAQVVVEIVDADHPLQDREFFDDIIAEKKKRYELEYILDRTKTEVAIRLLSIGLWENNPRERTLLPFQDWLIENFEGVLYVDGGDFYNQHGLVS